MLQISWRMHAGELASEAGDEIPTEASGKHKPGVPSSVVESQALINGLETWRPVATICGVPVGCFMLLLLGVGVLVCTTLAILLPQHSASKQELTASIWQQTVYERGFEIEVRPFLLLL
jgi:hypothetical protein